MVLEQRRQRVIAQLTADDRRIGVEVTNGMVNPVPEIVKLLQHLDKFGNDFTWLAGEVIEPERNSEVDIEEVLVGQINESHRRLTELMHQLLDGAIWQERELDEEAEALRRKHEGGKRGAA